MNQATFDKSRQLRIKARINEAGVPIVLTFYNVDGSPHAITGKGWELPLKKAQNTTTNVWKLTEVDGLTVFGDNDNKLRIEVSQERAEVTAQTYFWTLYSSEEDHTWLNGDWDFHNGVFDGVEETEDIVIAENGSEITITITGDGGGGLSTVVVDDVTIQGDGSEDNPLAVKSGVFDAAGAAAGVQTNLTNHENNTSNPHSVTKAQVGLSNVDNTSDANKPVSTAQATADALVASNAATDATTKANAAQSAAQTYADGLVVGLWDDRGNFDASVNAYPSSGGSGTAGAIKKGDVWTISVAGTLPTAQVVEIGDIVRALVDTPGNTQANWSIQQNNIGYTAENSANKDTDGALTANSDTKYASQKATKTYADLKLAKASNLSDLANAATARTNLGGTTVGQNLFTLTNPGAIKLLRVNADNTVTAIDASEEFGCACSDETTVLAAASTSVPVFTRHMPYALTLTRVFAGLRTAGTGASQCIVDIHVNGTTIMSSTKILFTASVKLSADGVLTTTALAAGDYVEIFLDQRDTNNVATGLKTYLVGYK